MWRFSRRRARPDPSRRLRPDTRENDLSFSLFSVCGRPRFPPRSRRSKPIVVFAPLHTAPSSPAPTPSPTPCSSAPPPRMARDPLDNNRLCPNELRVHDEPMAEGKCRTRDRDIRDSPAKKGLDGVLTARLPPCHFIRLPPAVSPSGGEAMSYSYISSVR